MNGRSARSGRSGAGGRRGGRSCRERCPKLLIVSGSLFGIEQTNPRRCHFVQQPLGQRAILPRLKRPQMGHLAIGSAIDHVAIGLEKFETQQPILVRRLLLRRNSEPNMIRIEIFCHGNPPNSRAERRNNIARSPCGGVVWAIVLERLGCGKVPTSEPATADLDSDERPIKTACHRRPERGLGLTVRV